MNLIRSVVSPGAAPTEPSTSSVRTPSPSTPETSPTLAQSIRTQSTKRSHRKRLLPVLGRKATPSHSEEMKEKFQDVEGLGMLIPRKINFAAAVIADEVVEDVQEILQLCSSSPEISADGSSPMIGEKEDVEDDPLASQKVSFPPAIL